AMTTSAASMPTSPSWPRMSGSASRRQAPASRRHFCQPLRLGIDRLITVRIDLLPAPSIGHHLREIGLGPPAQLTRRLAGIGPAFGHITGAARDDAIRHRAPGCLLESGTISSTE